MYATVLICDDNQDNVDGDEEDGSGGGDDDDDAATRCSLSGVTETNRLCNCVCHVAHAVVASLSWLTP